MTFVRFDPARLDPAEVMHRRRRMAMLVLALAGPAILTMADLHWRTGFDGWKALHLVLFAILFVVVAFGAAQAIVGFRLRRRGGDPRRIALSLDPAEEQAIVTARTAVVMPVCNEEVSRVIEALRVMYQSVQRAGKLPECDFFLLSDSTDPNCWVEEEAAWLALTVQLGAHGRLFYRKRRIGTNKKAGNIADFCRRWGQHYRYMIVLDADSLMTGDALLGLVRLMERNRHVGIVQGVPMLVNGETVLARMQQFATRLYGTIFASGLNYWQLGEGNYWGHNAIIRLAPFIRHCSLPELPGEGPFGGRIMSHDFVEAALMRRAGWEVWLVTDLEGNYEESPANVIEYAQRDRRWLQGNLQHARLVVARGIHPVNRLHFILGMLGYLASPLWLALLAVSALIAHNTAWAGAGTEPAESFGAHIPWSYSTQALCLFLFTLGLLFVPKVLALVELRGRPGEVAAFGGWGKLGASVLLETLVFTLLAPVLVLFHTRFVFQTLGGQTIGWGVQRRGREGESVWAETVRVHRVQTAIGLVAAVVVYRISPVLAAWMSPVLAGAALSIPLSYFTGSLPLGLAVRRRGIFVTPEESRPVPELAQLHAALARRREGPRLAPKLAADYGLLQAVLDPYVNAAHVSMLRAKDEPPPPASEERFATLRMALLRDGPEALAPRDRLALLLDSDSMSLLHHELWATPASQLAAWWRLALQHYTAIAAKPQTALSR